MLLVVPDADIVAGCGEWFPGDVEPAGAGEELVGVFMVAEEVDQLLEPGGVLGANVGGLTEEMLRVTDTTD